MLPGTPVRRSTVCLLNKLNGPFAAAAAAAKAAPGKLGYRRAAAAAAKPGGKGGYEPGCGPCGGIKGA